MADNNALTMRAEVVDAFSGPMKKLRDQILATGKEGTQHLEGVTKGFSKAEGAMQTTARTASSVVNPALATIGVTGLTVTAAVYGIQAALTKLTGNLSGLGQLSRETGVAADALQTFGAVAGRFNIEQDAVSAGAKTFAQNMRLLGRGTGETFQWLMQQGRDPAGRKAFQDFATDLQRTSDKGEQLRKSLEFMESIKDPIERGIIGQRLFGNEDFGRLADGHLGKIGEVWKKQREKIGPLDPNAIIQAEKFEQALADVRSSMTKVGKVIATEVLPYASGFTVWLNELVSGGRKDVTDRLRDGLKEISRELNAIDWKAAGENAKGVLSNTTFLVGQVTEGIKALSGMIRDLNEGNTAGALRSITGADGPLARRLAPRVGDDEIEARQKVEILRQEGDRARAILGSKTAPLSPELQARIDQAEREYQALAGRSPEAKQLAFNEAPIREKMAGVQRQLDNFAAFPKGAANEVAEKRAEELRREMGRLTEELRKLRDAMPDKRTGDQATAQQSSVDGGQGPFAGARIQSAAFGGSVPVPRALSGSGMGYRSMGRLPGVFEPEGQANPSFPRVIGPPANDAGPFPDRNFGGGRFGGLGGPAPRLAGIDPNSESGRRAQALRPGGRGGYVGPVGDGLYDAIIRAEGTAKKGDPYEEVLGYGQYGRPGKPLTSMTLDEVKQFGLQMRQAQAARGTPWGRTSSASGAFQIVGSTMSAAARGLGMDPATTKFTPETQRKMAEWIARSQGLGAWEGFKVHPRERAIAADALRTGRLNGSKPQQPEPINDNGSPFFPSGAPKILKPESMKDAPGLTMAEAEKMRERIKAAAPAAGRRPEMLTDPNDERTRDGFYSADDDARDARRLGIALRDMRARQEAERASMKEGTDRLDKSSARAGVVGSPKVEANGNMQVIINKAAPDTTVSTSASGELFKKMEMPDTRQMRRGS